MHQRGYVEGKQTHEQNSVLLAISRKQIKATMIYHCTAITRAKIKKKNTDYITYDEDLERLVSRALLVEWKMAQLL